MLENKMNEDQANENETPEVVPGGGESPSEPAPISQGGENEGNHEPDDHGSGETVPKDDPNETFPRSYVEKLRKSEAKYRERAQQSDELAHKLHAALVKLDGRLADPEDLDFNPEHLDDDEALAAAVTDLITRKPGLRAQQLVGDVGQGKRGSDPKPEADLISIIRGMQ